MSEVIERPSRAQPRERRNLPKKDREGTGRPFRGNPTNPGHYDPRRYVPPNERPKRGPGRARPKEKRPIKPYTTPGRTPRVPRPPMEIPVVDRGFVRRNFGSPDFGNKLRRYGSRLPPARLFDLFDYVEQLYRRYGGKYPAPVPNPGAGWIPGNRCNDVTWFNAMRASGAGSPSHSWNAMAAGCTKGQSWSGWYLLLEPTVAQPLAKHTSLLYGDGSSGKVAVGQYFWRPAANTTGAPEYLRSWSTGLNPNMTRGMASPLPAPVPAPEASEYLDPVNPYYPPVPESIMYSPEGAPWRPIPKHKRQPPGRGTKEGKVLSNSAKVGIGLFRALDTASEAAEVVSAIYDALPEHIKKLYNRKDRPGDSFGQYGLDGADWKLPAIYKHWREVDTRKAVENMFKNEIEDKIIGGYQKALPRNTVNAMQDSEKAFYKKLDQLLSDELGFS